MSRSGSVRGNALCLCSDEHGPFYANLTFQVFSWPALVSGISATLARTDARLTRVTGLSALGAGDDGGEQIAPYGGRVYFTPGS